MSGPARTELNERPGCWDVAAAGQRLRPGRHDRLGCMTLPGAEQCSGQEAAMPSPPTAPGTVTEPVWVKVPPGLMR